MYTHTEYWQFSVMHYSSLGRKDWPFWGVPLWAVPYGLSFHGQSSDSSEPDGRGLRGALGAASASPFKGQKIKIIELYTYGYRSCKQTRS